MKTILLVWWVLGWPVAASAQSPRGREKVPVLTPAEGRRLDSLLRPLGGAGPMAGRRVAFITGNLGQTVVPTRVFFQRPGPATRGAGLTYLPFTRAEQHASGGYDGLLLEWVKRLGPKQRQVLVRQLNEAGALSSK
jgi:hypothetical protein